MLRTRVCDVMTTDVVAARPDQSYHQLAESLTSLHISAVPVVDAEGLVVGVVSAADLILKELIDSPQRRFESSKQKLERRKAMGLIAADLMTTPAITTQGGATLAEAAKLMHDRGIKRLPVVDDAGRLVGIVTRGDLLQVFGRSDEEIRREIIDGVVIGDLWMDPAGLVVDVAGGLVKLSGQVDRKSDIGILTGLVRGLDGVVGVSSDLAFDWDDLAQPRTLLRAIR